MKSAEKGGSHRQPRFDAGKLIKGKKRHVLVDTQGLLLHGIVTAANVQDRDVTFSSFSISYTASPSSRAPGITSFVPVIVAA